MKKTLLTLMAAVVAMTAAAELREDAFVIRTTDGAAQGLLFGDVEKITFSNLDDEGVPHTGIYYQELHYPDTIIRVPVANITEVSFEKPRVKYQPNVVDMIETGLADYFSDYRETEIGYDVDIVTSAPENIMPKVGQILACYDPYNDYLFDAKPFFGKVKEITKSGAWVYTIVTEFPETIQDIYEELVGVETIGNNTPGVKQCLLKANALPVSKAPASRVDGDASHSVEFDVKREFSWDDDSDFSITGGVKGSIELRLAYEFSKTRNFLSVGTAYEYTPYFSFSFSSEKTWSKMFGSTIAEPIIEVTLPSAPIFSVYFGACPFIELSGTASVSLNKTFPTTKARTLNYYNDGIYRSGSANVNNPNGQGVANEGDMEISIDLEGSFHAGMALGLFVGTTRICKSTVGIGAELKVGPKITANMGVVPSMPDGSPVNTIGYKLMKNWNASISWCSIDMEAFFFKSFLGDDDRTTIAETSIDLGSISMSLLPSFDTPEWKFPEKDSFTGWTSLADINAKATVSIGSPDGDSLIPVQPGFAIYSEDDKLVWHNIFNTKYYLFTTKDDPSFDDLEVEWDHWFPNRTYLLYPAFSIPGLGIFRAEHPRWVKVETDPIVTGDHLIRDKSSNFCRVRFYGSVGEKYLMHPAFGNIEFHYGKDPELKQYQVLPIPGNPETVFAEDATFDIKHYRPGSRVYYQTVIQLTTPTATGQAGEDLLYYAYGPIRSFGIPDPEDKEDYEDPENEEQ